MKYIDRLLQGAPVEWLPLGEVAEIKKGKQLNKRELLQDGLYPAYNGGVTYSGFTNAYNYPANTIIVSQGGASAGFVNFVTSKFYANAHCYVVLPDIERANNRYLYHVLKWSQNTLMQKQQGAGIPGLSSAKLLQTPIPIPPVAVQEEVVRVLDKFTALEAELEVALSTELDCRKRQYGYYRDALLTFDLSPSDGLCHSPLFPAPFAVEWHPLGEVAEIKNGKDYKHLLSGGIPVYGSGGIMTYVDDFSYDQPSVLIPRKGSLNNLFYVDTPFWNVDTIFYTAINSEVIVPKFFYYYLSTLHLERLNLAGGVPSLTQKVLNKLEIPIPPLAVQERIVEILDKFDMLVNSISEGLPREIELRRKQYEYYRDALLSFEPLISNF